MNNDQCNYKRNSGLLVAQSVEHGTLNVIRSGIPGSWVRAPRWTKFDFIYLSFSNILINTDKLNKSK